MSDPHPTSDTRDATFHEGDRLGKFEIRSLITRGGMGEVYRAWDTDLNRQVAIKTLLAEPGSYSSDPHFQERFRQEARTVSQLYHENIVSVLELGKQPNGLPYIVMPFLKGEDLQKRLARARGVPLTVEEAAGILLGACRGVYVCHTAGIIHRDIKPGNIFLTEDQETGRRVVKVLDFGIAKPVTTEDAGDLTLEGLLLGTPGYMSPEQAHGLPADDRSDQYALGALLYSCLTLRKPYDYVEVGLRRARDKQFAVIRALKDGRGYPPPTKYRSDLPGPLEQAILKAMSSDPSRRFESVFEFSRQIEPFAAEDVRLYLRPYYHASPLAHVVAQASGPAAGNLEPALTLLTSELQSVPPSQASHSSGLLTTKSLRGKGLPPLPSRPPEQAGSVPEPAPDIPSAETREMSAGVRDALLATAVPVPAVSLSAPPAPPPGRPLASRTSQLLRRHGRASAATLAALAVLVTGLVISRGHRSAAPKPEVTEATTAVHPTPPRPPAPPAPSPATAAVPSPIPAVVDARSSGPVTPSEAPHLKPKRSRHLQRDPSGARIETDKRGRKWLLDASGRRRYEVDANGLPVFAD